MTDPTRLPTPAQLGLVIHRMLIDIRSASYSDELDPVWLAELTDVAELIPLQFINPHEGYLRVIAAGLHELAGKYPPAVRYTAVLDMTPDEIASYVLPAAAEPAPAAG